MNLRIVLCLGIGLAACSTPALQEPAVASPAESPAAASAAATPATVVEELQYRCAAKPDVLLKAPQKCEDGTFAEAVAPAGKSIEYFCPMHAEIVDEKPGRCPKCQMFLEGRVKAAAAPASSASPAKTQ